MDDHEEDKDEPEVMVLRFQLYIPDNEFGIEEGTYIGNAIVKLLRDNKDKPKVVEFIADMMEE